MKIKTFATRRHLAEKDTAGGALVLALVAVLVVSAFAASFLQLSMATSRRQSHATATKEAFYLAEAGLAEAYTGLAQARTGNIGSPEEPAVLGDGLFWVEANEPAPGLVELECTALTPGGRVTLGMAVRRVETSVSSLGMFVVDSLVIQPGSLIDGYDSRLGSYEDQKAAGTNARMGLFGSNGDLTIHGGIGTTIDGDVVPGVDGVITTTGSPLITGATLPRVTSVSLPEVSVPKIAMLPSIGHSGAVPLLIPAGASGYEGLEIGVGAEVIVEGPATLVLGSLQAHAMANLHFDTSGGEVSLFVENDIVFHAKSTITSTDDDPTKVSIQLASDELDRVELHAKTKFHGAFYAPLATVSLFHDFELFGVMSAKTLIPSMTGVQLHFDQALADPGGLSGRLPALLSWRVVDIPDQVALKGGDPFRLLGVDRSALPVPADAHEDQRLVLDYLDKNGNPSSYDGWESGFDWMDVGEVVSATRDGEEVDPSVEPKGVSPADQALIDFINDGKNSTGDVKTELLAKSPLSDAVLKEAILADPMSTGDLKQVLVDNSPLSADILSLVLDGTAQLSGGDKQAVTDAQ